MSFLKTGMWLGPELMPLSFSVLFRLFLVVIIAVVSCHGAGGCAI